MIDDDDVGTVLDLIGGPWWAILAILFIALCMWSVAQQNKKDCATQHCEVGFAAEIVHEECRCVEITKAH